MTPHSHSMLRLAPAFITTSVWTSVAQALLRTFIFPRATTPKRERFAPCEALAYLTAR
jgi:hypothetical protein